MPAPAPVTILLSDESIVVIDKVAGLLAVPAPGRSGPCAVDLVGRAVGDRVYPVHRLDEETSGALLFARNLEVKSRLEAAFKAHAVERSYLALASRVPSPVAGRIESKLQEQGGRMVTVQKGGVRAVTHYRTLERRGRHALVLCRLETGRRNQIRAHLAELGCVLVGDRKYGYRRGGAADRWTRTMLHAWRLEFDHPVTGVRLQVEAPGDEPLLRPPASD